MFATIKNLKRVSVIVDQIESKYKIMYLYELTLEKSSDL